MDLRAVNSHVPVQGLHELVDEGTSKMEFSKAETNMTALVS